jgi:pimeloyl-ACP methyl ester carboxylesterase
VTDCDIFTLSYATTLLPDIVGVWSADPDIPILATLLRTRIGIAPLERYADLVLVAHSMGGGLVAQRALVDDTSLFGRVRTLVLFGTPSVL